MALSSYGTLFSTGAIIGEISAISLGGVTMGIIDCTRLTDSSKVYVGGFADGGTVSITCFNSAAVPTVVTANTATATSFVISVGGAVSTNPTISFSAYVQSITIDASVDQAVTQTYTLRITGAVTIGNT